MSSQESSTPHQETLHLQSSDGNTGNSSPMDQVGEGMDSSLTENHNCSAESLSRSRSSATTLHNSVFSPKSDTTLRFANPYLFVWIGGGENVEVIESGSGSAGPLPAPGSRSPSPVFDGHNVHNDGHNAIMSTAAYANEPENQLGCRWLYPSQPAVQPLGFDDWDGFDCRERRGSYYRAIPPSQAQPKSLADADPITRHAGATENNEKFLDGLACALKVGDKCRFSCGGLFGWDGFIIRIDDTDPRNVRYYGDFSGLPNYVEGWNDDHGYPRHKLSKYFIEAETSDLDQCLVRGHPLASVLSMRNHMKKGVRLLLCDHTPAFVYYNDPTCWRIGVKSAMDSRVVHRMTYLKVLCLNPKMDLLSTYSFKQPVEGAEASMPSTSRKRPSTSSSSVPSTSKCVRVDKPKATALGSAMEAARLLVKHNVQKAIRDDLQKSQAEAAAKAVEEEVKVEDDDDEMEDVLPPQMKLYTVEAANAVVNALLQPESVEKLCKPICDRLDLLILKTSSSPEVVSTPSTQQRPTQVMPKAPSKAVNALFPRTSRECNVHPVAALSTRSDPSNFVTASLEPTEGQQHQAVSVAQVTTQLPLTGQSVEKSQVEALQTASLEPTEGQQHQAVSVAQLTAPLSLTGQSVEKSHVEALQTASLEPTEGQQHQAVSVAQVTAQLPLTGQSVEKSTAVVIALDDSCSRDENTEAKKLQTNRSVVHSDDGGSTQEMFKSIEFSTSVTGSMEGSSMQNGSAKCHPTVFTRECVEGVPSPGRKWKDGERSWCQLVADLGGDESNESAGGAMGNELLQHVDGGSSGAQDQGMAPRATGISEDKDLGSGIGSSGNAKVDVKNFDFKMQLPLQPYLVASVKAFLTKPKSSPMASTLRPGSTASNVLSLKGGALVGPIQSLNLSNLSPVRRDSDGDTNDAFAFAEQSFLGGISDDEECTVEYCPFEIVFDNSSGRRVCNIETAMKVFEHNPLMRIEVPNLNGVCALRLTVGSVVWVDESFSDREFTDLADDAYSVAVAAPTPLDQMDVYLNTLMTNFYKPFPTPVEYGKSPRGGKVTKRTRIIDLHLDHQPPFNSFISDAVKRVSWVGGHSVMEVHGRISGLMRQLQRNRRNTTRYSQMRFCGLNPKQCDKVDDEDDEDENDNSANF